MKVTIYAVQDFDAGFEPVGDIRLVDGVAVPDPAVEPFLEPLIIEPVTMRQIPPSDGEAYLRNLPAQYVHRSRLDAVLYEESESEG
jgi:hypothetical protein